MTQLALFDEPRFKPLDELRCETCGAALLPYRPETDVRVFQPELGRVRAWCCPEHAAAAGWPWVASG